MRAPAVHAAVAFLLDHLPPTLHLVVASREDPPLPLPRLRARRQLVEVRAADLGFSVEEATALLGGSMGLGLAEAQVATLVERTEGWAAGLQLAGLALRDRPDPAAFVAAFTGGHRLVADYLMAEVLERQPATPAAPSRSPTWSSFPAWTTPARTLEPQAEAGQGDPGQPGTRGRPVPTGLAPVPPAGRPQHRLVPDGNHRPALPLLERPLHHPASSVEVTTP